MLHSFKKTVGVQLQSFNSKAKEGRKIPFWSNLPSPTWGPWKVRRLALKDRNGSCSPKDAENTKARIADRHALRAPKASESSSKSGEVERELKAFLKDSILLLLQREFHSLDLIPGISLSGRLGLRGNFFAGILCGRWTSLKTLIRSWYIIRIRDDVMDAIRYQIGDGTSVSFWHHPWLTNGPLSL